MVYWDKVGIAGQTRIKVNRRIVSTHSTDSNWPPSVANFQKNKSNMNKRAETEKFFWLKFLVIGLGTLGYGAYAGYDAFVTGPHRLEMSEVWEPIKENDSLSEKARDQQWKEAATEHGWPTKRPKKKYNVKSAKEFIWFNYGLMGLCWLIAAPCLFWCLKTKGTWIESTDNGLRNSAGQELTLDQITKVDKAKWDKKGIAVLHYKDAQGAERKFLIDDLKYERATTDEIMVWIEESIDTKLVVNGRLETQIAADKAKEAAEKAARLQEQQES